MDETTKTKEQTQTRETEVSAPVAPPVEETKSETTKQTEETSTSRDSR